MEKENYGRPLLRKLVIEALSLGMDFSFVRDMDANFIIMHKHQNFTVDEYHPPTAAAACWLLKGAIAAAKSEISALMVAQRGVSL